MHSIFDRLAILLSSICIVHCVAFPVIASLIPMFATTLQHGYALHEFWFHHFILLFILPLSLYALTIGYRKHRQRLPIVVASIGLIFLVITALFAGQLIMNHIIPHQSETILTIIGGVIHAIGHIMNLIATGSQRVACTNH